MPSITIGTTPVLLANANKRRTRWQIQFIPSSIEAGNTGKVYVGRGFTPNATLHDPNQGEVLNAGAGIEEKKSFTEDTMPYKGQLWAVADTANQYCTFVEEGEADVNSGI